MTMATCSLNIKKHSTKKNMNTIPNVYCIHIFVSEISASTQIVLQEHTGILLIRELPDTVKQQETEAQAYCAVWDLMTDLEKE